MVHTYPVARAVASAKPAEEPVTLYQAKTQVSLPESDASYDSLLLDLIAMARETVEHDTGMVAYQRTYTEKRDSFPVSYPGYLTLNRRPLVSLTSIQYIDFDGDTQTLAASKYEADGDRVQPVIWLAYEEEWPTTRDVQNAVTITYVAGHSTVADIPELYVQACKLLIAREFEDRCGTMKVSASVYEDRYESLVARLMRAQVL